MHEYHRILRRVCTWCRRIGLRASAQHLEAILPELNTERSKDIPRAMLVLNSLLVGEMQDNALMCLPAERATHWNATVAFDKDTDDKFPGAAWEFISAREAYAVGLNAACIFHAMLAFRFGLQSLCQQLEVPFHQNNPHEMLQGLEHAMRATKVSDDTPSGPSTTFYLAVSERLQRLSIPWAMFAEHESGEYIDDATTLAIVTDVQAFFLLLSQELCELGWDDDRPCRLYNHESA